VVRIKPDGLFGPGDKKRAMSPQTKPTMMSPMIPDTDTTTSSGLEPRLYYARENIGITMSGKTHVRFVT
jgi:hypothetical protein